MSAAAAVPLLLLAVAAVEIARVITAYRRALRLNRALHELRRPLQSISLSIEGHDPDLACAQACLEQARGALEALDAVVNRRPLARRPVRTALTEITDALEDRWRFAGVRVTAPEGGRPIDADPVALGAALDNLVANAIEHGGGEVGVRALASPTAVRFEVREDGGAAAGVAGSAGSSRGRDRSAAPHPGRDSAAGAGRGTGRRRDNGFDVAQPDPRRGHGLAIAAATASGHGGSLVPPARLAGGGAVAALSLPVPPERSATR